ncbi:MAG: hypoxanthine phosphoribosyltransferase [Deltaproteobacteria bacterium]|nr:hypoxanthine phosphoribosyltransferase [Deltaproteobacteria bacterium]
MTPLLTEQQIADRLPPLAAEIAAAWPRPERLVLVGPLKGCVIFMADLSRALWRVGVSHDMDFVRVASYGAGTESSGVLRLESDLYHPVEGRDVLLVDDICDSGRTMDFVSRHLACKGARAVRTAVLMDKPSRRALPFAVDHVAFTIPNAFVVGYGCDLAEGYRGVPYVGIYEG